jgi:hypothetical protein
MWNQQKLFGAIYARPIWSRIGLASHLYANHRTKTLLNFRTGTELGTDRKTFELEKLFEIDPAGVQKFFSYYDRLPICIEEQDTYTLGGTMTAHTDQLKQFYCNFLIDIVAETFSQGRSFYPTEKTTRPMLLKKPFIVHGPKCFLIHLRQMGFRTFHEFWDEDYDGYGPEHKYHKILELIDTIADMSAERLTDMYAKMQPILDHNYNLLIEQSYRNAINYVE